MDAEDDPYTILGVTRGATAPQIKTAYRKAALRHHPDKVAVEEREAATLRFSRISHAYEILSDPQQRARYDQAPPQQQPPPASSSSFATHDDVFGRGTFHDPFEVFESVFGQEFGRRPGSSSRQQQQPPMDAFFGSFPFVDPFGNSFFGGSMPGQAGDLFGRQENPFGRGFGGFPMAGDSFPRMFEQMQQQQQMTQDPHDTNVSSYTTTSTSSSTVTRNGEIVTTHTTCRRANGQDEVCTTERIVHKADGTVERQLLHNGAAAREPPRLEGSTRRA
jgi:curved DNA-binding protein CbpA